MLEFEEARDIVFRVIRRVITPVSAPKTPFSAVKTEVLEAYGRVLAEPVLADRDLPAVRRSLRDGFAVRSSDVPGTLKVRGEVRAGEAEQPALRRGEALEIMTGAPVPDGADAVVMVEHVTREGGEVKIERAAEPGQFINERGAEAKKDDVLIPSGTRIDAGHVATLVTCGKTRVNVARRPSVAILATGDELVELEQRVAAHQIRNSNSYMLAALVVAAGGMPHILPVARDNVDALRRLLQEGLSHDLLLISGGVSAGRYDLVKPTLKELGAEFHFERVRIQPGQPTAFGTVDGKPVFGLPGNPGSSFVTFELFAKPAIELLSGITEPILPLLWAKFEAPFRHKGGLTRFLPALLSADGQHLRHVPWQGSSDVPALAKANAFLVADHDRENWGVGDLIRVMRKS